MDLTVLFFYLRFLDVSFITCKLKEYICHFKLLLEFIFGTVPRSIGVIYLLDAIRAANSTHDMVHCFLFCLR